MTLLLTPVLFTAAFVFFLLKRKTKRKKVDAKIEPQPPKNLIDEMQIIAKSRFDLSQVLPLLDTGTTVDKSEKISSTFVEQRIETPAESEVDLDEIGATQTYGSEFYKDGNDESEDVYTVEHELAQGLSFDELKKMMEIVETSKTEEIKPSDLLVIRELENTVLFNDIMKSQEHSNKTVRKLLHQYLDNDNFQIEGQEETSTQNTNDFNLSDFLPD
jgi:hypothetical protein